MYGLSHISQPSGKTTTCSGLSDNVLLWNTRVRIDASFMGLTPNADTKSLYAVSSISCHDQTAKFNLQN